jgi:hypothetical protein
MLHLKLCSLFHGLHFGFAFHEIELKALKAFLTSIFIAECLFKRLLPLFGKNCMISAFISMTDSCRFFDRADFIDYTNLLFCAFNSNFRCLARKITRRYCENGSSSQYALSIGKVSAKKHL